MITSRDLTRRAFLARSGGLVVSFSLFPTLAQEQKTTLPGPLKRSPMLDSWIRIGTDGAVTVFTGKAELGQGIKTALIQVAAEELAVDPRRIELVTADTSRTPNEGYTAGSQSMSDSGTALLHAAAQARGLLLELAAKRLSVPVQALITVDGEIRARDGRTIGYGDLVTGDTLHVAAQPQSALSDPNKRAVIGTSMPRVDIPPKVTGGSAYVQDLRLPDMVHARVVRPPSYGAKLRTVDMHRAQRLPGVLKIVRNGSYLAVVAEREYQAIFAMRALASAGSWDEVSALPAQAELYSSMRQLPAQDTVIADGARESSSDEGATFSATYYRPYQMHGSIGPSCAVARFEKGTLTLWTHSQGVYPLRDAIAEMLQLPRERVRCIHWEGSGCYGHNGADDVAADAALIAAAFPDRAVRVQWMREDEHSWEPYGTAMISTARARLDRDRVTDFQYEVWSGTHNMRPGPAGNLAPSWHLARPLTPASPQPIPQPAGGGDRNAIPIYKFDNTRVVHHFIASMPLRVSALRSLGAYMNVFSIESFVDELAKAARVDPVEFRLRYIEDPRAREVIGAAAERFGWMQYRRASGHGHGFGFARYKNFAAYTAVACEVAVERETGEVRVLRVVAADDSGEIVNPDGIRNQIEGGIVQSISWTLYETVTFDDTHITSVDWASYPVLRFANLPQTVDVHVINRPGQPFLGTGESAQGPMAAAIANAVADAIGVRIRELPISRARIRAALV